MSAASFAQLADTCLYRRIRPCEVDCREQGKRLAELLQSRNVDAALDMLTSNPSLAWVRDDDSGGFPLHIAVWHVRYTTSVRSRVCSAFVLLTQPCMLRLEGQQAVLPFYALAS